LNDYEIDFAVPVKSTEWQVASVTMAALPAISTPNHEN
jgi:hypothetical protein